MSAKLLPSRPNLEFYKEQAKDLVKAYKSADPVALQRIHKFHPRLGKLPDADMRNANFTLADAQWVIARELGFPSWAPFKEKIASMVQDEISAEAGFLEAACSGNQTAARRILNKNPVIAKESLFIAAMLGEFEIVNTMLKQDGSLAVRKGGPKNWNPLLYLCFSRFHRDNQQRSDGIVRVAKLLLSHGADPNTCYLWEHDAKNKLPALWAATAESNHPTLARVLLEAGANPNDGESIYHCTEKYHRECLDLLHEFGANLNGPFPPWNNTPLYFILGYNRVSGFSDAAFKGARWLLEHGVDPNVPSYDIQERPVHLAASNGWGVDLLELLLKHGADVNIRRRDGKTAYDLALRRGNTEAAKWLRQHGSDVTVKPKDELLIACARGDQKRVRELLAGNPGLLSSLENEDRWLIHSAASEGNVDAVRIMLEAGWPVDIRDHDGATPLHGACWFGQLDVVQFLLDRGAPVNVTDTTYQSTPVWHAVHGSQHCQNPHGDYPTIVETLIAAGAELRSNLYGSKDVQTVLRKHGVKE